MLLLLLSAGVKDHAGNLVMDDQGNIFDGGPFKVAAFKTTPQHRYQMTISGSGLTELSIYPTPQPLELVYNPNNHLWEFNFPPDVEFSYANSGLVQNADVQFSARSISEWYNIYWYRLSVHGELSVSGITDLTDKADLAISMTASPDPVLPGGSIGYDISIKNKKRPNDEQSDDAQSVVVKVNLPSGVIVYSTDPNQPGSQEGNSVTFNFDTLAVEASQRMHITGHVAAQPGDTITATATVSAITSDPDSSNNSAEATVRVSNEQLVITRIIPPRISPYTGRSTFISTETILLEATLDPPIPLQPVTWQVLGTGAGSEGVWPSVTTPTDSQGVSTFTFTPADNASFQASRLSKCTGSRRPNDAIAFDVIASATIGGQILTTSLSATDLPQLEQDERDILRQEYVDFAIPVPDYSSVVESLGPGYNQGNYGVQLSVGLDTRYNAILAEYHQQPRIPATAPVVITSGGGYRNPRRNIEAGSLYPDSKHVRGRALDLQPGPVAVRQGGRRTMLSLHGVLYPALATAGSTQGTAIAEHDSTPVPVGDPNENHIHVQW